MADSRELAAVPESLASLRALIAGGKYPEAERVLASVPDDLKSRHDFPAQIARLRSRMGRHEEAVEALSALPRPAAVDALASIAAEHLGARSLSLVFGLVGEARRAGYASVRLDGLYRKAFLLPVHVVPPSDRLKSGPARRELTQRTFELKWPGLPKGYLEAVERLDASRLPNILKSRTLGFLLQANGVAESERSAYAREVLWGALADILYKDTVRVSTRAQIEQVFEHVAPNAFADFVNTLSQGDRPVLLVGAHAGLFQLRAAVVGRFVRNTVYLGAAPFADRASFMSVRSSPERALYFMVRNLRKPGVVGIIAGDGSWGTAKFRTRLFHREVDFGLGAPFIAFHAKCQPVWHALGWEDGVPRMTFELGPTPAPDEPYDAWVPRWFEFFTGKMREIVTGNPRNIRARGGLWPTIGNPEPSSEDEEDDEEDETDEG